MTPPRLSPLTTLILAAMAGACSPVTGERTAEDPARQRLLETVEAEASPNPGDNCLLMVWSEQDDPDIEFDRAHDAVKGGAISCATGASPSQFEAAISSLRDAAKSGDRARILDEVGIPLLYITDQGERRELTEDEVESLFDEVFDDNMLDLLQRLDLSQMTVEKDQGGFFELGSLWLIVDDTGQPRVMTVNRQALGEAAAVARDQAERGEGEALR
ncbi:hypothetical protein K3152_02865 [Qipengyuania sp. 1NDH17]|uniref:Uncharacterized protein n=1 Tax=Qipengyuania polymorpha TaxID=2867234 RepID=A0ABS7J164_9SPHN|nr:hypothetical protein [Qipengyuania polymorpha]MBX7457178.1 hypothetical protein [Qipengyuania polymorpha]